VLGVVVLKRALALLVKGNQTRHDFAQTKLSVSIALLQSVSQELGLPHWFKSLAKIIDRTEQVF
jgi:hypothetical protein